MRNQRKFMTWMYTLIIIIMEYRMEAGMICTVYKRCGLMNRWVKFYYWNVNIQTVHPAISMPIWDMLIILYASSVFSCKRSSLSILNLILVSLRFLLLNVRTTIRKRWIHPGILREEMSMTIYIWPRICVSA